MADVDECFVKYISVPCLSGLADLQKCAEAHNCKLSEEANSNLLYMTLKKLGANVAQKVVLKLMDEGKIDLNDEGQEFEIEKVLDHQVDEETQVAYYYVKWKGWGQKHNTWEPADNLSGCDEAIRDYHSSQITRDRSRKRKRDETDLDDGENSSYSKLQDLFDTLQRSKLKVSPLMLLQGMTSLDKMSKFFVRRGLLTDRSGQLQFGRKGKLKAPNYTNKRSKSYKNKRLMVQKRLKEWEQEINKISLDPSPIFIENDVDLEGPPENFMYINDYLPRDGIVIPQDPMIGCTCEDCYAEKSGGGCCPSASGTEFAYYLRKRVRLPPRSPIYECNKRCKCGPECPNRVVQQGRKFRVAIFRTANGKGWGVRALQKIKKGSFVMEYVGEVITTEEAERRGKIYDAEGLTYLFDLDYQESQDCPYTVDAGFYGNVSHFVNHSCEPNLAVYCVWINTLDPHLPRIALFSTKDIARGEELSFDYRMFAGNRDGLDKSSCDLDKTLDNDTLNLENSDKSASDIFQSSTEVDLKDDVTISNKEINEEMIAKIEEHTAEDKSLEPTTPVSLTEDKSLLPTPFVSLTEDKSLEPTPPVGLTEDKSLLPTPPASLIMGESQRDSESNIMDTAPHSPTPADAVPTATPASPYQSTINKIRIKCQCGTKKCRGYLF